MGHFFLRTPNNAGMELLKVKRKAVRMQVTRLINEVDAFLTNEALNLKTICVHRGRHERHQLTEVDNAIGILV